MKRPVPTYELYGEESGERPDFWLHCETIPSRSRLHHWEIGLHRHESFFQILYIAKGSGDALFDGTARPISPPAVITIPPAVSHGFRFSADIDGFVFTVLASHLPVAPGGRNRLGGWLATPRLTPLGDSDDGRYIAETLQRLAEEWDARRSHRTGLLDAYLTTVLGLAARLADEPRDSGPAGESENERRMERFDALLRQHYLDHRPAAYYARELGLSPTHLNRVVRAVAGQSVHEVIAGRLLDAARRQLVFTRASVQEISFRLGFSDAAYFSRFFVRHIGMTPRAWRITERQRLGV
ncbi:MULTISPECIES: helix-turn-helix domain-containing protein [Sinorhizobium]|uniref:AraC family transcriptional regulator n=2 Tax=Sinorhizobium TaxID=28105 RepID=A0A2S3YS38_9HYPH|nr:MULTISPECIES: helix-turn-helix domain-containing protein [Sinorhizobium]AUX80219.1 AraC family transcriptional regulator protein [Sinorhizobium fredii]PDT43404.1 AraC family transcriptional regulator [Sinorhizobium sp. FG01]POH34405.1 AraC family transcriptional regulator [Sinorhizobium americanum]